MIDQLFSNLAQNPMAGLAMSLLTGKTKEQKIEAILQLCKQRGIDVDAKCFSKDDLDRFGLTMNNSNIRNERNG